MEPPSPSESDRTWAAVAHLAPLVGYLFLIGQILLPLAILLWGPKSAFVQSHAKESLNGQISYTIYGLVLLLLAFTIVGVVIALPLGLLLLVLALWNMVMGALAAGRWERYSYALILRLVP
ncbi:MULTISPECIES: DUF4870 domain-containing protein [unclassified Meiothermus]|uniref:DUF4870 domain-containing protein n=1 Tax=unclassified Meiothermus TaxID=370471 RepID=UPI000D7CF227|nr:MULTISPECIES: DUF4870 domain-containing protein [unclassified Meiothermus]PZA06902.1 DUF4870 domain-containing protein [Meiothermus sp. Pnk-1]RYM30882.1 DUF4870 domain-containing protein [Meiothermus sp. PNK-Is4]